MLGNIGGFHELFEIRAKQAPNCIAIDYEGKEVKYGALNVLANQVAHSLIAQGVTNESLVGIVLNRSIELVACLLGILKAGAAFVPIDPHYPPRRIQDILGKTRLKYLVTRESFKSRLPKNYIGQYLFVDADACDINHKSKSNPKSIINPRQLAYVIYTSGSTGTPKGVMVEHASITNYLNWFIKKFINKNTVMPLLSNITFDAAIAQIFGTLSCGRPLIIPRSLIDIPAIVSLIQDKITILDTVPSLLELILECRNLELTEKKRFPKLDTIIVGGDIFSQALVCRIKKEFPKVRLYNFYGPTEATIITHYSQIEGNHSNLIGKPIPNLKAYVLDRRNLSLLKGQKGEICISGLGLARGYLNDIKTTQEKFIQHPQTGERLYKTGDYGKILPDGNFQFLGRMDQQVKIRGQRVELGEIESFLSRHPLVENCVVHLITHQKTKFLVAYYIGKNQAEAKLRAFLSKLLPSHMLPQYFIYLDKMPLNDNGKINHKKLPRPDFTKRQLSSDYIPCKGPIESKLNAIWQKVLGVKKIGALDNFFELGGHSLKIVQVQSRIKQAFHINIGLKDLFESPQIALLGKWIEKAQTNNKSPVIESVSALPTQDYYHLSSAQKRLWFLAKLEPQNPFYNVPWNFQLSGSLDKKKFIQALKKVINRHEILKTYYPEIKGQPVQKIIKKNYLENYYQDYSNSPKAKTLAKQERFKWARQPFDLVHGPIIRCGIWKTANNIHEIGIVIHHIACDDWSMDILADELMACYNALVQGGVTRLSPLKIQYRDYAHWHNQELKQSKIKKQKNYWLKELKGELPRLKLPTDYPRSVSFNEQGAQQNIYLNKKLSSKIIDFSHAQNASVFMTLLAGIYAWLHKLSGQNDLIVGSPIGGRNHASLENLIGFFVNSLPVRVQLNENQDFKSLVQKIKNKCLQVYENADYPFDQLVETLSPHRSSANQHPIFNVMFVHYNQANSKNITNFYKLKQKNLSNDIKASQFDLLIMAFETAKGFKISLCYPKLLFKKQSMRHYLDYLKNTYQELIQDPSQELKNYSPQLTSDNTYLVTKLNDTITDYPKDKTLAQVFEARAKQHPNHIAVLSQHQKLTYQELNQKANQLCHYLNKFGNLRNKAIAIAATRSTSMIIGLLGILKTGAAYVPIDSKLPKERVDYILKDTQARILLYQKSLHHHFKKFNGHSIVLDQLNQAINHCPKHNLAHQNQAKDLAYIIYTSGTTGVPKGVMVPQRAVLRLVKNNHFLKVDIQDRFLQMSNFTFDAATLEIWGALLNGATLVMPPDHAILSPELLAKLFSEYQINTGFITASLFNQIIDYYPESIRNFKTLLAGGEALSVKHIRKALKYLPDGKLKNGYGPTENTTFSLVHPIQKVFRRQRSIPIGRPIANSTCYILDHNRPVKIKRK